MHSYRHRRGKNSHRGGRQDRARGPPGAGLGAAPPVGPGPRHGRRADPGPGSGQVQRDPRHQRASRAPRPRRGSGHRRRHAHTGGHCPVDPRSGRPLHYVLAVKGNQKTLRRTLKDLPWKKAPSVSSVDTGHGRRVRRTVKGVQAPKWVDFPGAAQVLQVRRTRTIKGRKHVEVAYLICSLPMEQAQPEQVAAWVQGHWGIENRLHWVHDVVFDEDRHQLRTRNGPEIMTTLRNLTTRPHPPGPRHPSRHRLHQQIPVTTTKTRHQAHHPTNHLTRPCRPPDVIAGARVLAQRVPVPNGSRLAR